MMFLDKIFFEYHRKKALRKNIKYIFCINSGRSGSEYLASLLGTASKAYSFHEPKPQMIAEHLRSVSKRGLQETFDSRRIKSQAILKTVSKFPEESVYIETSHMFIKTFYDVVLHDLNNVQVIHLRRDLLQTLKSFVQLCYFSNRNTVWEDWMAIPNSQKKIIKSLYNDNKLDYIYLSIAYLIDIEIKAEQFNKNYKNIHFHKVNIEDLNTIDNVISLFKDLRLDHTQNTEKIIGKKINKRSHVKKTYSNKICDKILLEKIKIYTTTGNRLGVSLPNMVHNYL